MMSAERYRKHYFPLESNPDVFTDLVHKLGVSPTLRFQDVFTLDELELLPRPALALILIFPTSEAYESQKAKEEAMYEEYVGSTEEEEVVWFKQTINNACGLYAMLHAVCNGDARNFIHTGSLLATLLDTCSPRERTLALETSEELESAYATAAKQGDSTAPANAEDEVDFHFVCFAKSNKNAHVYELDGDRKGPIDRGALLGPNDDMFAEGVLGIVREFIQRERGESSGFSLMALVPR
ncbi:ubiquitin carboxyl-terminal hydrolase, family 1 [Phaeosphaeria sp. MPI-PUGE-AT-0046c]|nr:ubiquitin carboxyl-terminal hydrolase, family 1 [Phaeosphaeria sp. MPI-PUGE-AT-0046c]